MTKTVNVFWANNWRPIAAVVLGAAVFFAVPDERSFGVGLIGFGVGWATPNRRKEEPDVQR
jgi:hypothetical protein